MMKMIKRLYLTLLLMLFCITIDAAITNPVDGIFYEVYNENPKEVMVVKPDNNTSYSGTVTIPSSIEYQEGEETKTASVVAIDERVFQNCQLTALTIPATISSIGEYAFYNCHIETLTLVSWKQLCEDISFKDFYANPLKVASRLYFSSDPDQNPDQEVELTELVIPNGITKINNYVFLDFKMTSVTLPNTLTEIGSSAFAGCSGLTKINIPASVKTIGYRAFQACINTIQVTFAEESHLETIGVEAFHDCLALRNITIPANVTTISRDAFSGCTKITQVTFAENSHLETIGQEAFHDCSVLTGISIPASVTTIGYGAFQGCSKIASVTFAESANLKTIGGYAFYGCTTLSEISIPASVNSIGSQAFANCTGMRNQKVTFASKEALCQITFGDRYANPLYYAHHLYYQNNAKEVTALVLPEVENISVAAFAGGENIITVTIPEAVKRFGADAFLDCKSLQSVSYANENHIINMKYDNEYASPLRYAQYVTLSTGNISSIVIDQDISDNLFAYSVWLNKVTIGSGCTKIGKAAFKGCEYLSTITIEDGLETIDNDAFYDCKNLETIILPSTLKTIGSQAFRGCYRLKNIIIPAGVENLSQEIFMYCTGLESVTIASTNITIVPTSSFYNCTALKDVQLPNTIQTIGRAAFGKCSSLTALPTSSGLTSINNNAFAECNGIQTLELPSTVNFISQGAFSKCKGLTQLIINAPASANEEDRLSIQSGVFADCDNLGTIYTHALIAPKADPNAFGGKTDIQLYYDKGATGYNVAPWSNFGPEIKPITQHTITYKVDGKPHPDGPDTYYTGEYVTPKEDRSRDGWDFSGWQEEIPDVMPNEDLVINGYFTTKQQIGDLYYHLDPNTAKAKVIYHDSYKNLNTIEIPATVTFETEYYENSTYNVVAIADTAFVKCQKLEEITIPNSVNSIGRGAFKDCTELYKKITLPAGVTVLSDSLFYNCKNLTEIEMGAVKEIGTSAFNECSNLSLSTLPVTVQKIGSLAFCNCKNLTEITIPDAMTQFADRIFLGCEALEEVTFDTNCQLDTLPAYTFQNCYNLKKITLVPTMNLIEEGAFMNCRSLDMAEIPGSIGRIKEKAFIGCSGITQIIIPESVKALGGQAFKGCTNTTTVIMNDDTPPSAIKTLFDDAIYSSATLYVPTGAKETYSSKVPWSLFKKIIEREEYKVIYMVDGVQYGDTLTCQTGATINLIDEPTKTYPDHSARKFSGWKNVPVYQTMPNKDITITGVFQYVLTYKDKDKDTDEELYIYKDSLWYGDKVMAPVELDSAGYTYTLEPELEQMPAYDDTITVKYLVSECEYVHNGIRYYIYTQKDPHAEIMPGQTPYSHQSVTIPDSITYKGVNYPVTFIRNDAFKDCLSLTTVSFASPSNVSWIGTQAFNNCNKLTEIDIPKSVKSLGNETFMRCGSLQSVSFEDGSALEVLPVSTFMSCSNLSKVELPTLLTTIANQAFMGCSRLKDIIIPMNVASIGEEAFQYCKKLEKITIANETTLPHAYDNTFDDDTYEKATLYVSETVRANLKSKSPWNNFKNPDLGSSTTAEKCATPKIYYNKGTLKFECDTEGAVIKSEITVSDAIKMDGANSQKLNMTYNIKASATAEDYKRSDVKVATIVWKDGQLAYMEGFDGDVIHEEVEQQGVAGDMNGDGQVTAEDAALILKKLIGKEDNNNQGE